MIVRKNDSIMVVVDEQSKVDHFISINSTHKTSNIQNIFIKEISILHGLLKEIVSDQDAKFTSNFWKGLF